MHKSMCNPATESTVEFKVLGPLEVTVGSESLELRGNRQQTVLAMLLLAAHCPVTMDRLLEAIYGENLPSTARSQVQNSILSLRHLLDTHGKEGVNATQPHGYMIRVGEGQLDTQRFEELVATAR